VIRVAARLEKAMDDSNFETLADRALAAFQTQIEDTLDDVDVEMRDGILTLELEDGRQYVINKHRPNRQIWLSSPVSGAAHFDYDAATNQWRSTRGGPPLAERLATELTSLTGHSISFD
jgi:frataxin